MGVHNCNAQKVIKQRGSMTQKEFRQVLIEELADQGPASTSQPSTSRITAPPNPAASHKLHYFTEGQNVAKRDAGSVGSQLCTLSHKKTPVGCSTCDVPLCFVAKRDCFNEWHTQNGMGNGPKCPLRITVHVLCLHLQYSCIYTFYFYTHFRVFLYIVHI